MSTNMELIETKTVGAGGLADVTFSTIPTTYTDLVIKYSARSSTASFGLYITINASSPHAITSKFLEGDGSTASSYSPTDNISGYINRSTQTASTFSNGELYFPNYRSSNNKSFSSDSVNETNGTAAWSALAALLWSNTAAITSIKLAAPSSAVFEQHSTFYLYGISSVTSTTKATGGIVSSDGTYNYHMFPYSGTFTPTQNITADYLVIAGGGSGGWGTGSGGGGAGGLRSTVGTTGGGGSLESALSLTANTAYTVTVGAGGAGLAQAPGNVYGNSGSNSVFSTITATGGGGGGGENTAVKNGVTGGSGGGGSYVGSGTGGAGTTNQGYAGGGGGGTYGGGGGGGASAVGQSITSGSTGGNGGNGVQITAFAYPTQTGVNDGRYAGGGGGSGQGTINTQAYGGTGGTGGGGAGAGYFNNSSGIAAIAGRTNTGGGGGGGGAFTGGGSGSGGSGLVIIRYAI